MPSTLDAQLARPDVTWPPLADGEARLCAVRVALPRVKPSALGMLPFGGTVERDEQRHRQPASGSLELTVRDLDEAAAFSAAIGA
jgi:hypothetical protein